MLCDVERSSNPRPRWQWQDVGGARLFGADGTEYVLVDQLKRIEVERLLEMDELDVVVIQCGGGVESWVGPREAHTVWHELQRNLVDVDGWRPPPGEPGARPYSAELRRSPEGRHLILFNTE